MNRQEYLKWIMDAIEMPLETRQAVLETEKALTEEDIRSFEFLFYYDGNTKQFDIDLAEKRASTAMCCI